MASSGAKQLLEYPFELHLCGDTGRGAAFYGCAAPVSLQAPFTTAAGRATGRKPHLPMDQSDGGVDAGALRAEPKTGRTRTGEH